MGHPYSINEQGGSCVQKKVAAYDKQDNQREAGADLFHIHTDMHSKNDPLGLKKLIGTLLPNT